MIILWSTIFVLVVAAQIEVQGALNLLLSDPLSPMSLMRSKRAGKCAKLISLDGGFIFNPGQGKVFPIPHSKGGLLIPGCLEIVYKSKKKNVVRAFEDLIRADLGADNLEPDDLGPSDLGPADLGPAEYRYQILDLKNP